MIVGKSAVKFVSGRYYQVHRKSVWMLLLWHNYTKVGPFSSKNAALNNDGEYNYSVISELTDEYKINNKFEFMIQYPEVAKDIIWKQSKNPKDEDVDDTSEKVSGFRSIFGVPAGFTGLSSSNYGCLYDGTSAKGSWMFCIGCTSRVYNETMPGPHSFVGEVSFWVRFPIFPRLSCNFKSSRSLSSMTSMIVLVLIKI